MFKLIALLTTSLLLTSCASVTAKSTVDNKVLANVEESDTVIVADARTVNKVAETNDGWKKTTHNWNTANGTPTPVVPTTPKQQIVKSTPTVPTATAIESSTFTIDKSTRLFMFFFSMMLMGMLGAGIIGLIESISGRNSLDTTPVTTPKSAQRKKTKK